MSVRAQVMYHPVGKESDLLIYYLDDGSKPPMSNYVEQCGIPEEALDFIDFNILTDIPQRAQLELPVKQRLSIHHDWVLKIAQSHGLCSH